MSAQVIETEGRLIKDVARDLGKHLDAVIEGNDCRPGPLPDKWDSTWPGSYRWIACFAVRGGSEGHYVHVEVIGYDPLGARFSENILLGKTFLGADHALRVANECARALDAV